MSTYMRALIWGAAIGIAVVVTTTSPTQSGMIGPRTLQITEPASLVEAVRSRTGSVSAGSSVRAGGVARGGTRVWPGRSIYVDSRALNLKAVQVPRGRYCHHGGCRK